MKTVFAALAVVCGSLVVAPLHAALAPVFDESVAISATSVVVSPDDHAAMLPAKARALVEMNLPEKIAQIQQQMTQLRGQLEMAQHHIKQLEHQQRALSMHTMQSTMQSTVTKTDEAPSATHAVNDEADRYQAAFAQLQQKHYDLAMAQFNDYLARFPKGKYRANTYYWLGEIYLLRKQNVKAVEAFDQVIEKYPLSHKVPDAMLKKGMAFLQQGQTREAQQMFQFLVNKFPVSSAAKLAIPQLHGQSGDII